MSENVVVESAGLVEDIAVIEERDAAARRLAEVLSPATIESLVKDADTSGMGLDGPDGLFNRMTKAVLERALQIEMVDHLGYEKGDAAGHGSGNSRNGSTSKNVITNSGSVQLNMPRDRASSFEPRIVPKRSRHLGSVDDMILSLVRARDDDAGHQGAFGGGVRRRGFSGVDLECHRCGPGRDHPVADTSA